MVTAWEDALGCRHASFYRLASEAQADEDDLKHVND